MGGSGLKQCVISSNIGYRAATSPKDARRKCALLARLRWANTTNLPGING